MSHTLASVELYLARLPLVRPFTTSSHTKTHLDHILIRVRDLDGADVGTGVGGSGSRTLLWHADGRGMVAQSPTCATGRGGRLARAVLALATGFVTCRRCDVPP